MTDIASAVFALLFLGLFATIVYALEIQHAKERKDLYRLIKAETLTDYISNQESAPPKGRNPISESIRRSMSMGGDE
jgi:hypothetical protein